MIFDDDLQRLSNDSELGEKAADEIAALRARVAELEAALREVMDVPRVVDEATVPRAGQNSAPEQVVYTLCVSYARLKRIEKLLEGYTP